ncbi:MAG: glycoside hydrolase family 13 protein [Anaerolineales bacterium]|nr:glycoside hydrolase family 13 protein [Anaerolineales bacterium]MCB8951102.1 glycoside hydrolase family 13 protein [Ardenticatenales bacterium]
MQEFIFGPLSNDIQRQAHERTQRLGVRHDQPTPPPPDVTLPITVTVALPRAVEKVLCHLAQPDEAIIPLQWTRTEWDLANWQYRQVWEGVMPAFPHNTIVRYTIHAYPADGSAPIPANEGERYSYQVGQPQPPEWSRAAIIYQVFPDRFSPGEGRDWNPTQNLGDIYGGTLRGIIEKLDYIADLGCNCIWLNPFFPDTTHHGYHATDYFQVNPRLGTMADIRELVDGAHQRGMRVLLDFVANHWGSGHDTFQQAQTDPDSPYINWYHWHEWPHDYKTFFGVKDLPQVNVNDPGARDYLLDAARFWLTDVHFDGYRLDYACGPSHDFWVDFRATVKAANPDAWIFGEVIESPMLLLSYGGRLDGCLDFLLLQALRDTFAFQSMSLAQFDGFLRQHEAFFPDSYSRPSFLDNHDMNRFLWLARGDTRKLKLAALCQFTLSGAPIVYYGTETGLSQNEDLLKPDGRVIMEECRLPMVWGEAQDADLLAYYRWLIHFRRRHPALWQGVRQTVYLDEGVYAYTRSDEQETILVTLNRSEAAREVTIAGISLTLEPWTGDVRVMR